MRSSRNHQQQDAAMEAEESGDTSSRASYRRVRDRDNNSDGTPRRRLPLLPVAVREEDVMSPREVSHRNFMRHQTVEVLATGGNAAGNASGGAFVSTNVSASIPRSFSAGQTAALRQALLNDQCADARLQRTGTGASLTSLRGRDFYRTLRSGSTGQVRNGQQQQTSSGRWRLFYRLPRSLRFRQMTRTRTRYINRSNEMPLTSRIRAKKSVTAILRDEDERYSDLSERVHVIEEGQLSELDEIVTPVADPNVDIELQRLHQKSSGKILATKRTATEEVRPEDAERGRPSSVYSIESAGVGGTKKSSYRIVRFNENALPLDRNLKPANDPAQPADSAAEAPLFASNEVRTSQYTWWSFVPVFLYLTFQKTANLYFLMIGIFQMIPEISPTQGVPLQFIPLSIVITIDAIFAAYEDYKRHVADHVANSAKTMVFNREMRTFEQMEWKDIKVGDFVKIKNRESIPADLLILSVVPADSDQGKNNGTCYVETKNLDGETNLKLREAPQVTRKMFEVEDDAGESLSGYLESEMPNGDINQYSGTLYVETLAMDDGEIEGVPITLKNILLRGSKLRNTKFVYGLVVNTGVDTKIMMSSGDEFPVKLSSIDEMTNRQVVIVVGILIVIALIGALTGKLWTHAHANDFPSTLDMSDIDSNFFASFVYFFTTLASMVPITLYVTVTMVRAFQVYFMQQDVQMYDEEGDTPMTARNMQLNEQLGQISHIFSDKTGTLTCNRMEFRKCSINGVSYGKGSTAIGIAARMRNDVVIDVEDALDDEEEADDGEHVPVDNVNFRDKQLWNDIAGSGEQSRRIREFFTHLALCHSVLIESMDPVDDEMKPTQRKSLDTSIRYSASSPDEQALVSGAKFFGFEFAERVPGAVTLRTPEGALVRYDVLEMFEFDSNRKRMSIIVRKQSDGDDEENEVLLLCKGADSMLLPRLEDPGEENPLTKNTLRHMENFARDGLRTLLICSKRLPLATWESFYQRYQLACTDLSEVEAKSRGEKNLISSLQDEMEQDLRLLGATAIEDRLQDGVPETMERLARAGICIWVLTGDMEETAINIGYACRLINNDMQRHVINGTRYRTRRAILKALDEIFHTLYDKQKSGEAGEEHALVIDGASLGQILDDSLTNLHLLRVSLLCKVVIACRVSPQQKAQLVELVKVNIRDSHTLSIGDGANDVPMIQSAHIGIGISGQEGMQAVNSSDFALGQFRFLSNLLLVHGRWNYNRMAIMVLYTFYKNIVYCLAMFWYMLWISAYSGTMVYSAFIQQGYNMFFTALPILVYAVLDQDVRADVALKFPVLYHAQVRQRTTFTYKLFWKWMVLGLVDSLGVYFVSLGTCYRITPDGTTVDFTVLGSVGWTILCSFINVRFCMLVNSWDVLEVVGVLLSVLVTYGFQWATDSIDWPPPDYDTYTFPWMFGQWLFWFGQLLSFGLLIKNFMYHVYCRQVSPSYNDLLTESLILGADQSVLENLVNFRPPPNKYLTKELAEMMDYSARRIQESVPVRFHPARSQLYRGFAFDQPAAIMSWVIGNALPGHSSKFKKAPNSEVRRHILNSDDPVIFENQRFQPLMGYGSTFPGHLLPTDRARWSDRSGKVCAMAIPTTGLELNLDVPGCDEDGWVYENDFQLFPSVVGDPSSPPQASALQGNVSRIVEVATLGAISSKNSRRRGLVRRRQWVLSETYRTPDGRDALGEDRNSLHHLGTGMSPQNTVEDSETTTTTSTDVTGALERRVSL